MGNACLALLYATITISFADSGASGKYGHSFRTHRLRLYELGVRPEANSSSSTRLLSVASSSILLARASQLIVAAPERSKWRKSHELPHCSPAAEVAVLDTPSSSGGNDHCLVGNPNVGKSTLFNAITGARQHVVNAPGTTVEMKRGVWKALGANLIDLPGTYSLIASSPDEQVVSDTLSGAPGSFTDPRTGRKVDLAVVLLDASAMTRSLYLLGQVAQAGHPVVAIATMVDVSEKDGQKYPVDKLAEELGIPFWP